MMNDLVTENAELELQLMSKKAEQTKAEETLRREQQQMKKREQVRGSPEIFPSPQHLQQWRI